MKTDITLIDVKRLGFTFVTLPDVVYLREHNYEFEYITLRISKKKVIQWHKESQECVLFKVDSIKKGNIIAKFNILTLQQLESIIKFYIICNDKKNDIKAILNEDSAHACFRGAFYW